MSIAEFLRLRPELAHLVREAAKSPLPQARCAAGPVKKMTKLERDYASHLEFRKTIGDVIWWAYEMYTFKFAPDLRYTPDFSVLMANHVMEFHETKGPWFTEDSKIKVRLAAAVLPHRFKVITREEGQWKTWDVPADFMAEIRGLEILERKSA